MEHCLHQRSIQSGAGDFRYESRRMAVFCGFTIRLHWESDTDLRGVRYCSHCSVGTGPAPVLLFYTFASYPFYGEALGASGTDGIFSCPARNADKLLSKFVTIYAYEFNDENAPPPQSSFNPPPPPFKGPLTFPLGAYHTAELQYLVHWPIFRPAGGTTFARAAAAFQCDDQLLDAVRKDGRPELLWWAGLVSVQRDSRQVPIVDTTGADGRIQL